MDAKDQAELEERRLTEKVHARVESVLLRRYSIFGAIAAVILTSFISLTVREILSESQLKIAAAEKLQEASAKQLADAAAEARKISQRAIAAEKTFADAGAKAETKFRDLSASAESIRRKISTESQGNLQISADLRTELAELSKRVAALSGVVQDLAARQQDTALLANAAGSLQIAAKEVESKLDKTTMKIARATVRAELSKYPVGISRFKNAEILRDALLSEGFDARIYMEGKKNPSDEVYSGIKLSEITPADIAAAAISEAKKVLPFLDHVFFSEIGTFRMYFGYNVDRSKYRSLSDDDFKKLTRQGQTQSEFRDLILSYKR